MLSPGAKELLQSQRHVFSRFFSTEDSDCHPACWVEVQTPALLSCRLLLLMLFAEVWHLQCREAPAAGLAVRIPTDVLNQDAKGANWGSVWLGNTYYFICPLLRLKLSWRSHLTLPLVTCFTVKPAQAVSVFRTKAVRSPYSFPGLTQKRPTDCLGLSLPTLTNFNMAREFLDYSDTFCSASKI